MSLVGATLDASNSEAKCPSYSNSTLFQIPTQTGWFPEWFPVLKGSVLRGFAAMCADGRGCGGSPAEVGDENSFRFRPTTLLA